MPAKQQAEKPPTTQFLNANVSRYLERLGERPRHGKRTDQFLKDKLVDVVHQLATDDGLKQIQRVKLIQERYNLEAELDLRESMQDIGELEAWFIEYGAMWAERVGVHAQALKDVGVPANVIKQAGIS